MDFSLIALILLIISWVLAAIPLLQSGTKPSPLDFAVWAIAVTVVFRT